MTKVVNTVELGAMGRVAYGRVAPNEDLSTSIEDLCRKSGFRNAFVRGALGSLVDATLTTQNERFHEVRGPAVEIVSLAGEVRTADDGQLVAILSGVVADPEGNIHGGVFVPGANTVCMTLEVTLEEWLPQEEILLK